MDLTKKLSFLVILVCVLIALKNQRAALCWRSALEGEEPSAARRTLDGGEEEEEDRRLTYDFYRDSCPSAEEIVRTTVRELHGLNSSVGPALLRLAFHDLFVHGRSIATSSSIASLTSPETINPILLEVLRSECSQQPASPPSQSPSAPSPSSLASSLEDRAMKMDYEGVGNGFGYRSLMQGKGLLVADQQLTARDDTKSICIGHATVPERFWACHVQPYSYASS